MSEHISENPERLEKEVRLQKLQDVANSLLSSESREYLATDVGWSVDNISTITFYIAGELQNAGHDFEEVLDQAGVIIQFDPDADYVDDEK